ncbi:Transposase, Mutator family [Streptomyces melanosporofaciens]|uniref:Mutator family transposase n=1 Tax=Streptomyces melanosporofaciens TaxID=67327 RepID=A0A1H4KLR3_STRMJ|nr:Transposase, Mutator family [Streptomyces melanosporofaciens]
MRLLRNSFRYAARQDWDKIAKLLESLYTAATEGTALDRFAEFTDPWDRKYPAIVKPWESEWEEFTPFLRFDTEVRRIVCTTNAIESVNARSASGQGPRTLSERASSVEARLHGRDVNALVGPVFSGCRRVVEGVPDEGEVIRVTARAQDGAVSCPACGRLTGRVYGFHRRTVADVPVDGRRVLVSGGAADGVPGAGVWAPDVP